MVGDALVLAIVSLVVLPTRAQIRIVSPDTLASSLHRIDGTTATFGAPFYGERILGRLLWAESTGCREENYDLPDLVAVEKDRAPARQNLINVIMVRRGKCSFVTKVKVAQRKHASAVVIVDQEDSRLTAQEISEIIIADDGYGGDVHIPSLLIPHREGQQLINAVRRTPVEIELAWDVPVDGVVRVDQWMNSASRTVYRFLKDFSMKRKVLNGAMKFVPHFQVFSLARGTQAMNGYSDLCSDSSLEYCADDPDGAGPITGKEVLLEDMRQLCIHEIYQVRHPSHGGINYATKYWDYVEQFLESCPVDAIESSKRFGRECSDKLQRNLGIDVNAVNHCIRSTMQQKLSDQRRNVAWSPRALRINGWRYSGTLDAGLVVRAICAGFRKQPHACKSVSYLWGKSKYRSDSSMIMKPVGATSDEYGTGGLNEIVQSTLEKLNKTSFNSMIARSPEGVSQVASALSTLLASGRAPSSPPQSPIFSHWQPSIEPHLPHGLARADKHERLSGSPLQPAPNLKKQVAEPGPQSPSLETVSYILGKQAAKPKRASLEAVSHGGDVRNGAYLDHRIARSEKHERLPQGPLQSYYVFGFFERQPKLAAFICLAAMSVSFCIGIACSASFRNRLGSTGRELAPPLLLSGSEPCIPQGSNLDSTSSARERAVAELVESRFQEM